MMEKRLDKELELAGLIAESYQRELLPEERERLEAWLDAAPGNRAKYEAWRDRSPEVRRKELGQFREDRSWEVIERRTGTRRLGRRVLWYAACAALLLGGFAGLLRWQMTGKQVEEAPEALVINHGEAKARLIDEHGAVLDITAEDFFSRKDKDGVVLNNVDKTLKIEIPDSAVRSESYRILDIPVGGEYRLVLSDGTAVWLNSGTRLRFPVGFNGKERKVYLEGEACFDVAANVHRPFVVSVEGMDVRVLGTLFNVKAYKEDAAVYTTLARGKVETVKAGTGRKVSLAPNEQCVYNKADGRMETRKVDAQVYLGWSQGRFIFENEHLEEIMKQLQRWYDVEVFYQNPGMKTFRFTGNVGRLEKISAVLELLELTHQVTFEVKGRVVFVK